MKSNFNFKNNFLVLEIKFEDIIDLHVLNLFTLVFIIIFCL